MNYPWSVIIACVAIMVLWRVRNAVLRALDRRDRIQARRIKNALNNIRDFSAMQKTLMELQSGHYVSAKMVLIKRLNEIKEDA